MKQLTIISLAVFLLPIFSYAQKDVPGHTVKVPTDPKTGLALKDEKGKKNQTKTLTKTYKGAWFDVKIPSNFSIKPSKKSSSGYESVFFESPDKLVEFYVFSPQSFGKTEDIYVKPAKELLVSKEIKDNGKSPSLFPSIITNYSIKAIDGSYLRTFQETAEINGDTVVYLITGIKYKSEIEYNKYKQDYINFKKSLIRYAD